jgi:hypothetical protein
MSPPRGITLDEMVEMSGTAIGRASPNNGTTKSNGQGCEADHQGCNQRAAFKRSTACVAPHDNEEENCPPNCRNEPQASNHTSCLRPDDVFVYGTLGEP